MSAIIKVASEYEFEQEHQAQFKKDILVGLSSPRKHLLSKYFYDTTGSKLFNKITHHPDYYLTDCEIEILYSLREELAGFLSGETFNLVELGPGEGIKPKLLINTFLEKNLSFCYYTIDISKNYLNHIVQNFNNNIPSLNVIAINADFLSGIKYLGNNSKKRNLVLFLGSSIGNLNFSSAVQWLGQIWKALNQGDYLLIGFDLRKNIDILLKAYNDSDGLTRAFNLNLLRRINKNLDANFDLDSFNHYGPYNVYLGAMESYLISLKDQIVSIGALNRCFSFSKFEPIHVEYSYKYLTGQIQKLAKLSNFTIIKNYFDKKEYFVNSLWQVRQA